MRLLPLFLSFLSPLLPALFLVFVVPSRIEDGFHTSVVETSFCRDQRLTAKKKKRPYDFPRSSVLPSLFWESDMFEIYTIRRVSWFKQVPFRRNLSNPPAPLLFFHVLLFCRKVVCTVSHFLNPFRQTLLYPQGLAVLGRWPCLQTFWELLSGFLPVR